MNITNYTRSVYESLPLLRAFDTPWSIVQSLREIILEMIPQLDPSEFTVDGDVAVHKTASVDATAHIQGPAVLSARSLIGPNAFVRGGVFLGVSGTVGYCSEVKRSLILEASSVSHLNYVGDSIIGARVNLEAGAVVLNYFGEREDRIVFVKEGNEILSTTMDKFGALVGDDTNIGGNAVLSPGTILLPGSIVGRGEVVRQL